MSTLLLFAFFVTTAVAIIGILYGANLAFDPFGKWRETLTGFCCLLLGVPCVLTGSASILDYRINHYPPLQPIAAPDLAKDVVLRAESDALIADLSELEDRLKAAHNEIAEKTVALETARDTISTLQERVKALEATRINAPAPVPAPIAVSTPPAPQPRRQWRLGRWN